MLAGSDFITIHTPHTDQTEHVIDARRLALLKPDAYLINTSRGTAIDEAALIDALLGRDQKCCERAESDKGEGSRGDARGT